MTGTPDRITLTEAELAAAFTEWDRRYREEPDRYWSEAHRLLRETPATYGAACTRYLLLILAETRGEPTAATPSRNARRLP